ncbi:MAG TPA: PAS domain S-box protein, partial [Desulfatirhabdiaceae bacterium]|nr:PAS domain S-box protein [Desulfatirhabdiaceae bacterium]
MKESEERYRNVFHNNHANMLLSDPETMDIIDANPAACNFYGYSCRELTGKKLTDINVLPPDVLLQRCALALSNQQNHFISAHRLSSGQIRDVEVFVGSVRIKDKPLLFSVIHDITERRQVEQRMVEVSEFIQKIFDASPLGIIVYDATGQCVMANEAVGRIIGASREDVLLQNFNTLDSWKKSGLLTAALEVMPTNQSRENLELNLVTTFGRDITLNCSLVPFSSAKQPHLLLMGQDISRQKLADEAVRQSQKLASIGILVAGIAHEINNPNGFIFFNLPILRDYLQELMPIVDDYMADHPDRIMFGRTYEDFRKDLFKLLDNIERGAQKINVTVSGLTDFSRKRKKLEPCRIALKPVIEHAVLLCREEIRNHAKTLQMVVPENLPPIRTDPEALEQILVNLLINAAHASNKADSWIRLSVQADSDKPGRIVIAIEDNGCGMD